MILSHAGKSPHIDPGAWVAPDATICGDIEIAALALTLCVCWPSIAARGTIAHEVQHGFSDSLLLLRPAAH